MCLFYARGEYTRRRKKNVVVSALSYRCTPHVKTRMSPAMLALGTELRMPFDIDTGPPVEPKTDEEHRNLVAMRLKYVCEGIPGLGEVKEQKGENRSVQEFVLGEKVWKRESKYDGKGFTPVFAPSWTGSFIIHSVWDKNVCELRMDPLVTGKNVGYLRNPINGYRLKPYVEGELLS